MMRISVLLICLLLSTGAFAQKVKVADPNVGRKVEKIYVNLYTDSLKRGQFNYINVDGLMSDGKYFPLDSNYISFSCKTAAFVGNSVVIPEDFKDETVTICIQEKREGAEKREMTLWIKKLPDPPLQPLTPLKRN